MKSTASKKLVSEGEISNHFRGYEVGYRRPPKANRFKPGQSGNPKGRRKGAKNAAALVHDILRRKIKIRDQGKVRHVQTIEAMVRKFAERALNGDPRAATFLLNWFVDGEANQSQRQMDEVRNIAKSMTPQEASDLWEAMLRDVRPRGA